MRIACLERAGLAAPIKTTAAAAATALALLAPAAQAQTNGVILQAFEWTTTADGTHWTTLKNSAQTWVNRGITAFWLPPAYKGQAGTNDVGYGVYDLFDLGEFNQKGAVRTRYGTKGQYIAAIDAIHAANAQVYADIVLNHRMGAEATERVTAVRVDQNNRNVEYGGDIGIDAWTRFTFPGRVQNGALKYNGFTWSWYHFDGVDWAQNLGADGCSGCRIYKFRGTGKSWDGGVSSEKGNYDYLMGADVDFQHPDVRQHLKDWGVWYTNFAKLDGFRIDATKHITNTYFNEWLSHVRSSTGKPNAFAVSEYWSSDINELNGYVNSVNGNGNNMSAFDVPLHSNFQAAGNGNGFYDMRNMFANTLVSWQPAKAVTFVDNHDTLDGRGLASKVQDWFKPSAYAAILLRAQGYPTVFLGDYDGVSGNVASHGWVLDQLLKARKFHAWGKQNDYFDDPDVVGFTREGDAQHWYGVAVLMTDNRSNWGNKWMFVGSAHANQCFTDVTGANASQVCANGSGWANFSVPPGKVTVWVRTGKYGRNTN